MNIRNNLNYLVFGLDRRQRKDVLTEFEEKIEVERAKNLSVAFGGGTYDAACGIYMSASS